MLFITETASLVWTPEKGRKLKELRGARSRAEVGEALKAVGVDCGVHNIQKLEQGLAKTVPTDTIQALLGVLGADISYVYQMYVPSPALRDSIDETD